MMMIIVIIMIIIINNNNSNKRRRSSPSFWEGLPGCEALGERGGGKSRYLKVGNNELLARCR